MEMEKEEYRQKLQSVVGSVGWTDVIRPELEEKIAGYLNMLADIRIPRQNETDDFIRGILHAMRWMTVVWEDRLREANLGDEEPPKEPDPVGSPYGSDDGQPVEE